MSGPDRARRFHLRRTGADTVHTARHCAAGGVRGQHYSFAVAQQAVTSPRTAARCSFAGSRIAAGAGPADSSRGRGTAEEHEPRSSLRPEIYAVADGSQRDDRRWRPPGALLQGGGQFLTRRLSIWCWSHRCVRRSRERLTPVAARRAAAIWTRPGQGRAAARLAEPADGATVAAAAGGMELLPAQRKGGGVDDVDKRRRSVPSLSRARSRQAPLPKKSYRWRRACRIARKHRRGCAHCCCRQLGVEKRCFAVVIPSEMPKQS